MKKILFISYHFPPSGSTGAIRATKFVKYMPQYGWKPIVIACKNSFNFGVPENAELLNEVASDVGVFKTFSIEPLNYFWRRSNERKVLNSSSSEQTNSVSMKKTILNKIKFFILDILNMPDRHQGWIPFAFLKGMQIIFKNDINVIFATNPPPSALITGYLLSKFTKKSLIVDYRDPWTPASWAHKNFKIFEKINIRIEKTILNHAKYIISVSDERARELQKLYPDIGIDKHIVITNGYDAEERGQDSAELFDKFTFIHAGHFYSDDGIKDFVDILIDIGSNDFNLKENIRVLFAGTKPSQQLFSKLENLGIASYLGRIPRRQCLNIIAKSHISLVFLKNDKLSFGCIASKVFDCMALRKMVLAVVPNGATKDLIKKTGIGISISPGDKHGLKKTILNLCHLYKNGGLRISPDEILISKYDRRELAKKLVFLCDDLIKVNS